MRLQLRKPAEVFIDAVIKGTLHAACHSFEARNGWFTPQAREVFNQFLLGFKRNIVWKFPTQRTVCPCGITVNYCV